MYGDDNPGALYREEADFRKLLLREKTEYTIKRISVNEDRQIKDLTDRGYCFLERCFLMEIPVRRGKTRGNMPLPMIPLPISVDRRITEDMYVLSKSAFPTDRRFHLEPEYDLPGAEILIRSYLDYWKDTGVTVLKVTEQNELLGFVILRRVSDDVFENVLGATKPGIKGKAVAWPLYNEALHFIEKQGAKKYIGRVSTANIPSINLHLQLGAKITSVYDEYILRERINR